MSNRNHIKFLIFIAWAIHSFLRVLHSGPIQIRDHINFSLIKHFFTHSLNYSLYTSQHNYHRLVGTFNRISINSNLSVVFHRDLSVMRALWDFLRTTTASIIIMVIAHGRAFLHSREYNIILVCVPVGCGGSIDLKVKERNMEYNELCPLQLNLFLHA